mgnify:FL=1
MCRMGKGLVWYTFYKFMINGKKIVSLIPLRGGSKSIPYKNVKDMAGKSLCFWVLKAVTNSKYVDEVWVSTEDERI